MAAIELLPRLTCNLLVALLRSSGDEPEQLDVTRLFETDGPSPSGTRTSSSHDTRNRDNPRGKRSRHGLDICEAGYGARTMMEGLDMSTHRIVCTEQVPTGNHPTRAKIVAVGVGVNSDRATERKTVPEVVRMMDLGEQFYTKGPHSGRTARVIKYWCHACSEWHIKSSPDAVSDNNLDSLRYCEWRAA